MKTLRDMTGWNGQPHGVGIEVEVEGRNLPEPRNTPYWRVHRDPSLRGGVEYVSNGALPLGETKTKALNILFKAMKERGQVNDNQERCGLHVHVNVMELNLVEIYTAICVSFLLDNLLTTFCGDDRATNLHCKPVRNTTGIIKYLKRDADKRYYLRRPFSNMDLNMVKYGSINLNPLRKFGTIEFRAMRYLDDPKLVDEWSTEVFNMVHNSAKKWKSPKDFMVWFLQHSKDDLLNILFSKEFIVKLKDQVPNWEEQIKGNIKLAIQVGYLCDWDSMAKNLKQEGIDDFPLPDGYAKVMPVEDLVGLINR